MEQLPAYNGGNQVAADPDTVTSTGDLGSLPGAVVGFGMSQAGAPSAVTSAVTAAAGSNSFSELQDSLLSSIAGTLGGMAVNSAVPGVPGLPSIGSALASEATKTDPNYGAAALSSGVKTGASLLGGALMGPIGAMVSGALAGYAVKSSMADGWMGDLTDVRSAETKRDAVEDAFGFDPSDTASMMSTQRGMDAFGVTDKGFGMDAAFGSTTSGQLAASAKESGLFDDSSLMGYMDRLDALAKAYEDVRTSDIEASQTGISDYSKGLNNAGLLGDPDIDSSDRQANDTAGGLMGGGGSDGGGSGGQGAGNAGGARGGGSEGNSGFW